MRETLTVSPDTLASRVRRSLLPIGTLTALCAAVLLLVTVALYRQQAEWAKSLTASLALPPAEAAQLLRALLAPLRANTTALILMIAKAVAGLGAILISADVAGWTLNRCVPSLKSAEFDWSDREIYRSAAKPLTVLFLLAALGLAGWMRDLTQANLGFYATMALVARAVTVVAGLALGALVVGLWRYSIRDRQGAQRLAEYLAQPKRRTRFWITAAIMLSACSAATDLLIPSIIADARALPRVAEASISDSEIDALVKSAVAARQREAGSKNAELSGRIVGQALRNARQALRGFAADLTPDEVRRTTTMLRDTLALICIWIGLGVVLAPKLLRPKDEPGGSWTGSVAAVSAGLLALPAQFVLDRIGVSAARPALWLAVFIPLVVIDVAFGQSSAFGLQLVYVTTGGARFHTSQACARIARVSPDRIRACERSVALRLGLSGCQVCNERSGT